MRNILSFISLLLIIGQADAQSVCESILKSANYNQYQSVAQNQQYSLQKANFCLAEYDKATSEQRAQIEASYKLFSAGAAGSTAQVRERQKQECSNNYGEYWFNQLGLVSQKVVSDKAMDTVAQCIKALGSGLRVEPTFSETEDALTVSLTWTRSSDLPFRGIIRSPSDNVICRLDNKETDKPGLFTGRVIKPGTSQTFSCERKTRSETIAGEKVNCLPAALIAIDVLESPVTINLFRRCETDYLASRATQVEAAVQVLRSELGALRNESGTRSATIENRIGTLDSQSSNFSGRLAAAEQRTKIKWKTGNVGSVTCQTYCNGNQWEGFSGECITAITGAHNLSSCYIAPGGPIHCLCAERR